MKTCRKISKTLRKCLQIFIKVIVGIILVPVLYIILPLCVAFPLYIIRKSVEKWAKHFRPDLGKILCTQSSILAMEDVDSEDAFSIVVGLEIRGQHPPDIQKLRNEVQKNTLDAFIPSTGELRYPELKQSIVNFKGFKFWAPVFNFKLENHVYFWNGRRNQSAESDTQDSFPTLTLKEAQSVLNDLCRKPWEKGSPLWEFIVLPNIINPNKKNVTDRAEDDERHPNCFFLIFRLHHALGDSYTILKFLSRAFVTETNTMEKVAKPDFIKRPSGIHTLFSGLSFIFKAPYEFAGFVLSPLTKKWSVPFVSGGEDVKATTKLSFAHSESISLKLMKSVKNEHGVGFTPLLFSMVAGGCREMVAKYYGKVPKDVLMGGPFPVPGHPDKLRNFVAIGQLDLPVGEADNLKRLKKTQKRLSNLKRSTLPFVSFHLSHLLGGLPSVILRKLLPMVSFPPLGITNVLAPNEQCYLLGNPMDDLYIAINLPQKYTPDWWYMFISYNGTGRLMVAGRKAVLPSNEHAEELLNLTMRQLNSLAHTAIV